MAEQNGEMSIEQMRSGLGLDAPVDTSVSAYADFGNSAGQPANSIAFTPIQEKPAVIPAEKSDKSENSQDSGSGKEKELETKPSDKVDTEAEKPKETDKPKETTEEKPKGKFESKDKETPESVQKRINREVFKTHQAERERDEAKREAAELKAKLAGTQATDKPATTEKVEKPVSGGFADKAPVKPVRDDFETIDEYLDARDKHLLELQAFDRRKADFEARQTQAAEHNSKQEEALSKEWGERLSVTAEDHPEIIEVVNGPIGKWIGEKLPEVADTIRRSSVGPEIMLYMHEHPDETLKVAKVGSSIEVAKFVGRIEAQVSGKSSPKPNTLTKSAGVELPEPVKVAGSGNAPSGVDLNDPKTETKDWIKETRRQLQSA